MVGALRREDKSVPASAKTLWIAAALSAFTLTTTFAATPPSDGTHVKVTSEMRGAGLVSSGVKTLPAPPVTGSHDKPVPAWSGPLPYPIVIADRRNNRLIEIAPDKRVIWEMSSPDLGIYRGNDDVFFSPDGKSMMVNEEDNYDIHIIDYASKEIVWNYGQPDTKGTGPDQFNFPDDAHLLADGTVMVADIRNCRIMFIDREKAELKEQWGKPGNCRHDPPNFVDLPNGVTPMPDGDILITEIRGSWITRITRAGKVVWSLQAPGVQYPSDAYPTQDGQVIMADYSKPGQVVIIDPATKKVTWQYKVKSGDKALNHPSLALELPNGNVIVNDDWRNRVLVIDRKTKQIVWQYGITDKAGHAPGLLFYPDGMDIDIFHDWKAVLGAK
jgi:DNA-binding beta-propeller fold protein YncE